MVILINPSLDARWLNEIIPELAILLAAASWALSLVLIKKLPEESSISLTRNILLAATIEILPVWFILGHPEQIHITWLPLFCAIVLGVFGSGIVYIFFISLIRLSGVNFASFSSCLVPVVGVFLGVIFLKEKLNAHEVFGCMVIAMALVMQTGRGLFRGALKTEKVTRLSVSEP